jgi:hypothetical protein
MHISFHVVSIRGGLYAHPLCQAPSVAGGKKSRPYKKNEDVTAVIVALCIDDYHIETFGKLKVRYL